VTILIILMLSQNRPAGNQRGPCGQPGSREHRVSDPWFSVFAKFKNHCFRIGTGSVYFTTKMLVATDRLKVLCHQSNIWSRGMTQYKEKGHFIRNTLSCLWCNG